MKHYITIQTLLILCFFSFQTANAQTPCGDCIIDLPALPEDTLFLTPAPDGQANSFYDADISFRVPMTTTPVADIDPDVPPGIAISAVTINSITNLPPGLEWDLSQSDFDTSEETDGCIKFCGTPLQPGLYMVEVVLTATVIIIDETTSFIFPLNILPATSVTEGFSITNNSGCGEVTVAFENNVPSNGMEGFSYSWSFGNGNTSIDENPFEQVYDVPGIYEINYEATIDTTGFILTGIAVDSTGCSDFLGGRPDLKIDVLNPDGDLIFVTPIIDNAEPPVNWSFNIPILEGNYTIRVVDADGGLEGADDICGTFNINQLSNGVLVDGETGINLTILNPIQTVNSVDTVQVFEQPAPPEILNLPQDSLCEGVEWQLSTNYTENLQWYQDSVPIIGGNEQSLSIEESGRYWVIYTSPDGCVATSATDSLSVFELPSSPVFTPENNLLTLFNPDILPENFELQWFLDADPISGANDLEYCVEETGNYSLVLTNLDTGCDNFYDLSVEYDPNFPACTTSTEDDLTGLIIDFNIFPNPVSDVANLAFDLQKSGYVDIRVFDAFGQEISQISHEYLSGRQNIAINFTQKPAGLYFVEIKFENKKRTLKLMKL